MIERDHLSVDRYPQRIAAIERQLGRGERFETLEPAKVAEHGHDDHVCHSAPRHAWSHAHMKPSGVEPLAAAELQSAQLVLVVADKDKRRPNGTLLALGTEHDPQAPVPPPDACSREPVGNPLAAAKAL